MKVTVIGFGQCGSRIADVPGSTGCNHEKVEKSWRLCVNTDSAFAGLPY
jgi:cell division GTPase FtsZ